MKLPSFLFPLFVAIAVPAQAARLNIVVSTPDLASVAREVGGDLITLTTLTRPTEDPHFVDAKPSFIVKLNHADAVIEGGAELELGWLPPLLDGARNEKLAAGAPGHISCAEGLQLLEIPSSLDRSKGDIHAAGNPHYMIDPVNAKAVAAHICEAFCKLDSGSAAAYRANLAKFSAKLDTKLEEWQKSLAPFRGKQMVAYHNMWPYFARRFGLVSELFLEPKPGIPPTPAHLSEVITKMKTEKIGVILLEPFQNRKTAESVASETGAKVVAVTQYPGGVKGTEAGYVEMIDYIVAALAKGLAASN